MIGLGVVRRGGCISSPLLSSPLTHLPRRDGEHAVERRAHHALLLGALLVGHARQAHRVDPVVVQAPVAEEAEVPGREEPLLHRVEEPGAQVALCRGEEGGAGPAGGRGGEGLWVWCWFGDGVGFIFDV